MTENQKKAIKKIGELKKKTEALKDTPNSKEIISAYEKMVKTAFEYGVEYDAVCSYGHFLYEQRSFRRALEICEALEKIFDDKENIHELDKLNLCRVFIEIIAPMSSAKKAEKGEKYCRRAEELIKKLLAMDYKMYGIYAAATYNSIGDFYYQQDKLEKVEDYHNKAKDVACKLIMINIAAASENTSDLLNSFATDRICIMVNSYMALARLYDRLGNPNGALRIYTEASDMRNMSEKPDNYQYISDIAGDYDHMGYLCNKVGMIEEAEKYYLDSIKEREKLAKEKPHKYLSDLADSYNNIGIFYKQQDMTEKAESYALKAIKIREDLVAEAPEKFSLDLSDSYSNTAKLYHSLCMTDKAIAYGTKAVKIREKLVAENPCMYKTELAQSYDDMAAFYADRNNVDKATEYYFSAVRTREYLAKENPRRFRSDLVESYNTAADYFCSVNMPREADELYLKANETENN